MRRQTPVAIDGSSGGGNGRRRQTNKDFEEIQVWQWSHNSMPLGELFEL